MFDALFAANSSNELHRCIRDAVRELGFDSFHYAVHAPVKTDGQPARFLFDGAEQRSEVVLSDYPTSWFARYQSERYIEVDPLVQHCTRSILPIAWHQLPHPMTPRAEQMFNEAKLHGLVTGVTFSLIGKSQESAIFSLTSEKDSRAAEKNAVNQIGNGQLLLMHIHEAMRRLVVNADREAFANKLSSRELECLSWVSSGKTSWEVSRILSLTERTVNFHIANTCQKLGVNTRTQAVARAINLGLITR